MAVNTNIYGLPEQWTNAFFQQAQITTKNKLASFGTNAKTLAEGVTAGKLSYDSPIDKSLSYCGLGTESAMSHVVYCGLHDNAFQPYDSTDREVTNFAFFEKQTNTQYTQNYFLDLSELNKFTWTTNIDTTFNYTQDLIPYTVVNPHNIILVIFLSVSHGDGAYYDMTLEYFIRTFSQYNWTRISRVKITPYFGNNTDNVAWSASAGYNPTPQGHGVFMGILDEYVVSAKNRRFYMYENPIFDWIPFGFVGENRIGSNSENVMYMCYIPETAKSHIKYDNTYREFYIEYYDGIVEDILKTVACFGLYFSSTTNDLGNLTNEYTYIGLIDADGVGRGRYLQGAETVNAPQAQADYTDMHNTGYTPSADETKYRNDTQFYAGYGTSSFTKFYALTEAQVNTLSQELYRIANDVPTGTSITEYNMKVFLTNNPIDCVISLKKFPVVNIPLATSDATIYLGSKATSITDGKILATPTWVYYFNFRNSQNTSCRPVFGDNFLDYEPYTKCKIVIPFCGTVDVPVSYIYQYDDLQIALVMDFITGACTAYVLVNGITIDSITGSCAIDLPVSGIQSATLDSQIHSVANAREKQQTALNTGLIAGAVSIGVGLATGSLPIAIGGGAAIIGSFMKATDTGKQINYELSHMDTPVKQVSAASGQIAHTYDMRCKMIITRPEISPEYSAEEYAQTIGFACLDNGRLQDFHGFTVANIDLSGINCTAEEKEMIRSAFASGAYLPAEYSDNYWT